MFVIYTPEVGTFLHSIIPTAPVPVPEWGYKINDIGIIQVKEDAIEMAREIQKIRIAENVFHFSVQVLELGENRLPNFKIPVFEISKPDKVSLN